jgi:hypothetical protein
MKYCSQEDSHFREYNRYVDKTGYRSQIQVLLGLGQCLQSVIALRG